MSLFDEHFRKDIPRRPCKAFKKVPQVRVVTGEGSLKAPHRPCEASTEPFQSVKSSLSVCDVAVNPSQQ